MSRQKHNLSVGVATLGNMNGAPLSGWEALADAQRAFQNAPIALAVLDSDLRLTACNDLFLQLVGTASEQHLGRSINEFLPGVAERLRPILNGVLDTGPVIEVELCAGSEASPDVQKVWVISAAPMTRSDGSSGLISIAVQDVTPRKRDEHELREQLRFDALLSDLSTTFVNVPASQLDAQIQVALQRIVAFLAVDRVDLMEFSQDLQQLNLTHCCAVAGVSSIAGMAVHARLPWSYETLRGGGIVRIDSARPPESDAVSEREWAARTGQKSYLAIPILLGGSPACALGISMFRSERTWSEDLVSRLRLLGMLFANALARRSAEEQIHRKQQELAHVGRVALVGQLATSIAHEINQPLCAVVSNAQAILRMLALPSADMEDVQAAIHDIVADGKRAGEVIRRAHALLRNQELKLEPLDLNEVLCTVAAILQSHALIRRIRMRCELQADLPRVLGDRVQLQQVVLNLATNGIEAIPEQENGPRELVISTCVENGCVVAAVKDSGCGVPPNIENRVFEPFFTTKPEGLGMGLAISRGIVEAHGGRMWISKNADRGATFHFSLPVAPKERS